MSTGYTGYRRYGTAQIATAQVIRRFRDLDMPLEEIHAVLSAPDPQTRSRLISAHLARLEASLARTQDAVTALRGLLSARRPPRRSGTVTLPPCRQPRSRRSWTSSASLPGIRGHSRNCTLPWLPSTSPPLALVAASTRPRSSPTSAARRRSSSRARRPRGPCGRVTAIDVPAAELAVVLHAGPHIGIDLAYGTLAAHVTGHALAVDGPIREYYLTGPIETPDQSAWRTEIGWPIFETAYLPPAGVLDQ